MANDIADFFDMADCFDEAARALSPKRAHKGLISPPNLCPHPLPCPELRSHFLSGIKLANAVPSPPFQCPVREITG